MLGDEEHATGVEMTIRANGAWRPARLAALIAALAFASAGAFSAPMPEKDESRILPSGPGLELPGAPETPATPETPRKGKDNYEVPPDFQYEDDSSAHKSLEDIINEDIPDMKAVELSEDAAKRALDAFEEVFGKFPDEEIAKYPTLQDFADKSEQGRKFAAIIHRHGFKSVAEWNDIISNIGFALTSIEEGDDGEIISQIRETEQRTDLPQKRKEKLLNYLRALIPSVNNRKIVQKLMKDPVYRKKLDLLEGGGDAE